MLLACQVQRNKRQHQQAGSLVQVVAGSLVEALLSQAVGWRPEVGLLKPQGSGVDCLELQEWEEGWQLVGLQSSWELEGASPQG